jgi:hypothetical protein
MLRGKSGLATGGRYGRYLTEPDMQGGAIPTSNARQGWEDRLIDDLPHRAPLVGVDSPERSPAR